jgi:hypothetical protein
MSGIGDVLARAIDPFSSERFLMERNRPFVKPGVSELGFYTHLDPPEEQAFQQWARTNNAPVTQDYDMRGFWQGLRRGDPHAVEGIDPNDQRLHFSDWWKTPSHESFSNESQFAGPGAPRWIGDRLVAPDGTVLFDDTAR